MPIGSYSEEISENVSRASSSCEGIIHLQCTCTLVYIDVHIYVCMYIHVYIIHTLAFMFIICAFSSVSRHSIFCAECV